MYNLIFLTEEVLYFFILTSTFSLTYYVCKYTNVEFGNIRKYFTTRNKMRLFHFKRMLSAINHVDTLRKNSSTE